MKIFQEFKQLLFVDVETTGLHSDDRIVSIGMIHLSSAAALKGQLSVTTLHAIFDPMKESHPKAEEVHGFDDWTLRHQEPFIKRASEINSMFKEADLIIAHNAAFDLRFIGREFELAGYQAPSAPVFCTMEVYRECFTGSSTLVAACRQFGAERVGSNHGALEDAWLAMQLFLWMNDSPLHKIGFSQVVDPSIHNFIEPPPRPEGPLPRRRNKELPAI